MPVAAVRPATEQYEPAGHEPHELEPELGWKVPAAQLEQNVDETAAYKPALQIEHVDDDVAAAKFDDLPAAHPLQVPTTLYWPAGQDAVHDVEPTDENCPLPQPTQALEPGAAEYVLLEQLMQLLAEATE